MRPTMTDTVKRNLNCGFEEMRVQIVELKQGGGGLPFGEVRNTRYIND